MAQSRQALKQIAQVKHKARIDRNRNLLPPLRYEIVRPEKVQLAKDLLYSTYHTDEPLTRHLGLTDGKKSIPDLDKLVERTIEENLSLFALDLDGNVMGVSINGIFTKQDWVKSVDEACSEFEDLDVRPLRAIRQQAYLRGQGIFEEMGTDSMFGVKMAAGHPSLKGMGMVTDIIRRSILLAGCLGFVGIKAEASALYAQRALLTIGFHPLVAIDFKDFEYRGEKVFSGIKNEHGMILFQKKFFQNCLKHIL